MWARRLSIRRDGPERAEEKNRRMVRVSFGKTAALVLPLLVVAALVAVAAGIAIGFLAFDWDEAVGGAVGGALGGLGATPIVAGALRRGGTRGGTAALV